MRLPENPESVWGMGQMTDALYRSDPSRPEPKADEVEVGEAAMSEEVTEQDLHVVDFSVARRLGFHHYSKAEGGFVDRSRNPDSE
jgi:hypothetical protein